MKLTIQDFQAHKNSLLDLSKKFIVIVGPTDTGKSSIVRAFRWIFYDFYRGSSFIRKGQKKALVSVTLQGKNVTRTKGKGSNSYQIDSNDYTSVGRSIPEEVCTFMNVKPIRDGSSEILLHVTDQHDSPFLIFESEPKAAKLLNRLTGVHIVDEAIREELKIKKEVNASLNRVVTNLSEVDARLNSFNYLEGAKEKFKNVESSIAERRYFFNRLVLLQNLSQQLLALTELKSSLEPIIEPSLSRIEIVESKMKERDDLLLRLISFKDIYTRYLSEKVSQESTKRNICEFGTTLKYSETKLSDHLVEAGVCPTCGQSTKLSKVTSK